MALIKKIELNTTGIELSYWNISKIDIDYLKNEGFSGTITVQGYLNKQARLSNKFPAVINVYELDKYLVSTDKKLFANLYEYLKTLPDFTDATDDL